MRRYFLSLTVVSKPVAASAKPTAERAVSSSAAASSPASVQERVQQKLRERLEEKQQKAKSSAMKADGSQSGLPLLSSLPCYMITLPDPGTRESTCERSALRHSKHFEKVVVIGRGRKLELSSPF